MDNYNLKQNTNHSDSAASNKEFGTLRLSSESHVNEQENISQYMNYNNGYYAYLRIGKTSGAIGFYPDSQTAYSATLKEYGTLLSQGVSGSRSSFLISDSTDNIIYEGVPKLNGIIHFSIYEGKQTTKTVTLPNNKQLTTKNNKPMSTTKAPQSTLNVTYSYEEGAHASTVKHKASIFIDKDILTQEDINFLCLSPQAARQLAKKVQEIAIINKDLDDNTFESAIRDVSLGMVTITKKLASGKPTDDKHCSMHGDPLYCASHSNIDYLFNDSNLWKRTPGKLNYYKLEDAIVDMYNKGKEMVLNAPTPDSPIIKEVTTTTNWYYSFNDAVQAITSTVMTFVASPKDVQFYLKMKGTTLESEIKSLTNNVMAINVIDNQVTFSVLSGKPKELGVKDYADSAALRDKVRSITMQLIICAALSDKTRESIAKVIDLNSIEDYISSLPYMVA